MSLLPESVDLGPLAGVLGGPEVTDVFLNGDGSVWVDRGSGAERVDGLRVPPGEARELVVRLIAAGGRHLDDAHPLADVRLGDGVRVHGALPPIAPDGAVCAIRVPSRERLDLDALELSGFFARVSRERVDRLVAQRANVLVTGAGGSGKTTLLGAMLSAASARERILVIEDVGELRIAHPHVVRLEARQPNLEGVGGVGLDRLVREALRMRPDRLVIGECRGVELRELLSALNTGHDGGAGTLHANSLADVPTRLEALAALVGWSPEALARQAVSAFDAILHVERLRDGSRRLAEWGTFRLDAGGLLRAVPS